MYSITAKIKLTPFILTNFHYILLLTILLIGSFKVHFIEAQYSQLKKVVPPLVFQDNCFGHSVNSTRVYLDKHVAGYVDLGQEGIDPKVIRWPFEYLAKAWRYVKRTYGYFGFDTHLYVILHSERLKSANFSTYLKSDCNYQNVIDSGLSNGTVCPGNNGTLAGSSICQMRFLTSLVGQIVETASKQTDGSPAKPIWENNWLEIFTYDVLSRVGMATDAELFLNETLQRNDLNEGPNTTTYWMRDWFLPIYTKYGGSVVLEQFFEKLASNFPRKLKNDTRETKYSEYMFSGSLNFGEFVHFWSGAAGEDLTELALKAFNSTTSTAELQEEMKVARIQYSALKYNCQSCEELPNSPAFPELDGMDHEGLDDPSDRTSIVVIAISVSVLVLGLLLAVIGLFISRRRNADHGNLTRDLTQKEMADFFVGNAKRASYLENKNNACIQAMPFNKKFELPRENLVLVRDQVLGSGKYGLVLRGFIKSSPNDSKYPVAVKTMRPDVEIEYFKAVLMELKVLAYLGGHQNIASLLGACTISVKNRELYVAMELCAHGDLRNYLLANSKNFHCVFLKTNPLLLENAEGKTSGSLASKLKLDRCVSDPQQTDGGSGQLTSASYINYKENITTSNLLEWSRNIANGMAYLSEKRVIHGDLAARNVLLTANNTAKISDFGLARQLANYATYLKTYENPLPWRWMALETLKCMKFSVESDVWAFGVTMWEIFALGEMPYEAWDDDFVLKLDEGKRLEAPPHANHAIFKLMYDCWKLDPKVRPSFVDIHGRLNTIIDDLQINESFNKDSNSHKSRTGEKIGANMFTTETTF